MKIFGVVPLEACLVMMTLEDNNKVGVAGFYDPLNKCFIRMDGKSVSPDFNKNLSDFIEKKHR